MRRLDMSGILAAWAFAGGCSLFLGGGDDDSEPDANPDADDATLASLEVSRGALEPAFDPDVEAYTLVLPLSAPDLEVTATARTAAGATIEIGGTEVASGAGQSLAVALGDSLVEVVVTSGDQQRTYEIAVNRGAGILQRTYFKAANPGEGDEFGYSVAIDGDTLVVGARSEDTGNTGINPEPDDSAFGSGAVYVFVRDTGGWSQQAFIKPLVLDDNDNFGRSVAISGDTIAVGAPFEDSDSTVVDDSADGAGAAYVFVRDGDTWSQQDYVKASNAGSSDVFGESVAVDGDTLVVGAPGEASDGSSPDDDSESDAGAVYVFVRVSDSWTEQAYLKAASPVGGDRFGSSVAVDGDTVAVGAPTESAGSIASGAAYVFFRRETIWTEQAYLKAGNVDAQDRFGTSVAVSGDTLAVGAINEDSSGGGIGAAADNEGDDSGAVYLYNRSGSSWSEDVFVKAPEPTDTAQFGHRVALDGDVLVVGAPRASRDSDFPGAAFVLTRAGGSWNQQIAIEAASPGDGDRFGFSVAVSGSSAAVGARFEGGGVGGVDGDDTDNSLGGAGAAYQFD